MADRADQGGKHTEAAELRCLVKDVANLFGERCVSALTFLPMIVEMPAATHDTEDDDDDEREYLAALEARIGRVEEQRQRDVAASRAVARQAAEDKRAEQEMAQQVLDVYAEKSQ